MGGRNHQPCRPFLEKSTKVSRALSQGMAWLEIANVELENILLAELRAETRRVDKVVRRLEKSESALEDTARHLYALKYQMESSAFTDLRSLAWANLNLTGSRLAAAGVVNQESWDKVSNLMKTGGFISVLESFDERVHALLSATSDLRRQISACGKIAEHGDLGGVLEENREGNFKRAFAVLYTSWLSFSADFLASSMLSTELWYADNGFGNLLEAGLNSKAV